MTLTNVIPYASASIAAPALDALNAATTAPKPDDAVTNSCVSIAGSASDGLHAASSAAKPDDAVTNTPALLAEPATDASTAISAAKPDGGLDESNDSASESTAEEPSTEEDVDATTEVVDADLIEMKTLRTTTSPHDDWLHRGSYLHDIPYHTYTEYVDRVRLPQQAPLEKQIFRFERHYVLFRSYGQRIKTPARTPVLEALKFVPPGGSTKEENALYKLLIGSPLRCVCAERCSDPLLFKPLLSQMGSAAKPAKWCWSFTWKARRAELEVLAKRAEEKTLHARRIPCIHDTTVVRGWLPAAAPDNKQALLLRATLAQYSRFKFGITWPDGFVTLFLFLGIGNTHSDQLTLAEFSALRTRRLVQNLDMMAIARSIELSDKKNAGTADDEKDDTDDQWRSTSHIQSEFMGGENDVDEVPENACEEPDGNRPNQIAQMTIDAAASILRRDDEVAAAKKRQTS